MRGPQHFLWRVFLTLFGLLLWLGMAIGPALILAVFLETVIDLLADGYVNAKRAGKL